MEENSLLKRWLSRNKKSDDSKNEKVESENVDTSFPLAWNQQGLYFLCQQFPDNPFYNYLDLYLIDGDLDVDLFIEVFQKLVVRHDIFRTRFKEQHGEIRQFIQSKDEEHIEVRIHDVLSDKINDVIIRDTQLIFDLENGPLLRLSILKVDDRKYRIGVITHHIIMDKWSSSVLREEVAILYASLREGRNQQLSAVPDLGYGKYAKAQREMELDPSSMSYWKSHLQNVEPSSLPLDYPRPDLPTFKGGFVVKGLPKSIKDRIHHVARNENTTPFNILLALFNLFLFKCSGQQSLAIGVPVSDKVSSEMERIIGYFDNSIVFHALIDTNKSFLNYLDKVKKTFYECLEHKNIPYEILVRELVSERTSGLNPLFQSMFIYHRVPGDPDFGDGINFTHGLVDFEVTKFDLTLFVGESENSIDLSFEYSRDLFKTQTVEKLLDHFVTLIGHVLDNPTKKICDFSLLNPSEFDLQVNKWNQTEVEFPNSSILSLIAGHCVQVPSNTAICCGNVSISYLELDGKSDELARYILSQDVGELVGLYMSRSVDMIIGMIGIMKAGKAYVPIDVSYPEQRIAWIIEAANLELIIINDTPREVIESVNFVHINQIDDSHLDDIKLEDVNISQDDLAYVIFTSGSSGRPKGVPVSHANLLNSTLARNYHYNEQPESFLLLSSFSFDSSVAGIYWTLINGGELVIAEERAEQELESLAALIQRHGITHTLLLPSLYQAILSSIDLEMLDSMVTVIVAGESCSTELVKQHFKFLSNTRLFNEYGPSEGTVWSTYYEIKSNDNHTIILIGKPIANTKAYVLDQDMNPLPAGISGKLYICGANTVRGYLTSESEMSFIDNPFTPGQIMYSTGDMARCLPDGNIVFLGRDDQQIKVRGHRIEIAEIEHLLNSIDGIRTCAVAYDHTYDSKIQMIEEKLIQMDEDNIDNLLDF